MRSLSQVVWSEGMYLGPHEFQAQARYFEDAIHFAAAALWFQCYGLIGCTLDSDALRNGTVSLVHASGIFPDGTPFHMPQSRRRSRRPAHRRSVSAHARYPDRLPGHPASANPAAAIAPRAASPATRAISPSSATSTTKPAAATAAPVTVRRKNIRLLLESELTDNMVALPLARVRRDGSGHFIFDPMFVPPCLQITASERLMLMLRRLIEILEAKSSSLSRTAAGSGGLAEFSTRDLANFWLMHAVNSGLAALRHLWISKRGHPRRAFPGNVAAGRRALHFRARLPSRARCPIYDHQHLGDCFEKLDDHIRTHLETIVPTNCVSIPLTKMADYFYEGEVDDTRCLGRARWVLGVHAEGGRSRTDRARSPTGEVLFR